MDFANPILFVGAAVLILVGALKGWLTRDEWMWGVGALAIPYLDAGVSNVYDESRTILDRCIPCVYCARTHAGADADHCGALLAEYKWNDDGCVCTVIHIVVSYLLITS